MAFSHPGALGRAVLIVGLGSVVTPYPARAAATCRPTHRQAAARPPSPPEPSRTPSPTPRPTTDSHSSPSSQAATRPGALAPQRGAAATFSHEPFAQGTCDLCHQSRDPRAPGPLVKATNELCLGCHDDRGQPRHSPAREACTNCHNPHTSRFPSLLLDEATALCASCHQPSGIVRSKLAHAKASGGRACVRCHDAHAGDAALPVGSTVDPVRLPAVGGGARALLGTWEAASLVAYVQPGQDASVAVLKALARCERDLDGRPLHWAAVVSGRAAAADIEALAAEAGIRMPVLVDQGDELQKALHLQRLPGVVLVDRAHRLDTYLPWARPGYCAEVRAHLRRLAGEVTDELRDRGVEPTSGSVDRVRADRELKLAKALLELKSYEQAITAAKRALGFDPGRAAAHVVIGIALAAMDDCWDALDAFSAALELEPRNTAAMTGTIACGGH